MFQLVIITIFHKGKTLFITGNIVRLIFVLLKIIILLFFTKTKGFKFLLVKALSVY